MKSYQEFRNEISVMEMAASVGYKYDPRKGTKWPVMVSGSDGDKIIIVNPKSSSNQGYFNPHDDKDKGTLIDFIKNRLGKDFPVDDSLNEAMNVNTALYAFNKEQLPEASIYIPDNKLQKPFTTEGLMDSLIKPGYLLSRHINRETLFSDEFLGRVVNIKTGDFYNTAFPFYNIDEKIIGIEKRNFSYGQFVEGSDRTNSIWHSNIPAVLDKIVIAESAIDAISYHQLKPSKNAIYVSVAGALSASQIAVIKALKTKSNPSKNFEFVSATDNDVAGIKYDNKLKELLAPDRVVAEKPVGKDYNLDLKNAKISIGNFLKKALKY